MTTKLQADKCVTHHYACDCREYRSEVMDRALNIIMDMTNPGCVGVIHKQWDRILDEVHKVAKRALEQEEMK